MTEVYAEARIERRDRLWAKRYVVFFFFFSFETLVLTSSCCADRAVALLRDD